MRTIVDLIPQEKSGELKGLGGLVRVLNSEQGLQLVVFCLELDDWRAPWDGQGTRQLSSLWAREQDRLFR